MKPSALVQGLTGKLSRVETDELIVSIKESIDKVSNQSDSTYLNSLIRSAAKAEFRITVWEKARSSRIIEEI